MQARQMEFRPLTKILGSIHFSCICLVILNPWASLSAIAESSPEDFIPQSGTVQIWKNCIGANETLKVVGLGKTSDGIWRIAHVLHLPQAVASEGLDEVSHAVEHIYVKGDAIILKSRLAETVLLDLSRETWKTPVVMQFEPDFIPEAVEATVRIIGRDKKQYMGALREIISVTSVITDERLRKTFEFKRDFASGIDMLQCKSEQLIEIRELDPTERAAIENAIKQRQTTSHSP